MEERPIKRRRLIKDSMEETMEYSMEEIMEDKMLTLVSTEGDEYLYPIKFITDLKWKNEPLSFLLKITIEDYIESDTIDEIGKIPLIACDSASLEIFIEFSKIFEEIDLEEFRPPLISVKLTDLDINQRYIDILEELYKSGGTICLSKLLEAMEYIDSHPFKHLVAGFISSKFKIYCEEIEGEEPTEEEIRRPTEEEIRRFFQKTSGGETTSASASAGAGSD